MFTHKYIYVYIIYFSTYSLEMIRHYMILVEKSNLVDGINKIKNHTAVKSTDQSVNFTGRIFYLFPPKSCICMHSRLTSELWNPCFSSSCFEWRAESHPPNHVSAYAAEVLLGLFLHVWLVTERVRNKCYLVSVPEVQKTGLHAIRAISPKQKSDPSV